MSDRVLTILAKLAVYTWLVIFFGAMLYGLIFDGGFTACVEAYQERPGVMWTLTVLAVYAGLSKLRNR